MPSYSQLDMDCLEFSVQKLTSELRSVIHAPGLKGFLFDDEEAIAQYIRMALAVGYDEGFTDRSGARRVEQLNDEGRVIDVHRSVSKAAIKMGVNEGSIQTSIREKTRCKGFRFRFKE